MGVIPMMQTLEITKSLRVQGEDHLYSWMIFLQILTPWDMFSRGLRFRFPFPGTRSSGYGTSEVRNPSRLAVPRNARTREPGSLHVPGS
jgi:hypothetical protein